MIYRVSEYRAIKDTVLKLYETHPSKLDEMFISSSIPLIAAYWFLNEKYGGFQEKLDSLAAFYNYEIEY